MDAQTAPYCPGWRPRSPSSRPRSRPWNRSAARSVEGSGSSSVASPRRAWIPIDHVAVSFLVRDETGVDLLGTTTFDERLVLPDLPVGDGIEVRFALENRLRMGLFAVSIAVIRVTRQDYADVALLDQADDCLTFRVARHPERPVHYRIHEPVTLEWRPLPPASG